MTTVTEQKKQELGEFEYDKEEYEDHNSEPKGPILFENRYVYEG